MSGETFRGAKAPRFSVAAQVRLGQNHRMTKPAISVCIPAYDMGGKGAEFLAASFDRLLTQSFEDFDIVVSDQSDSDGVAQVCATYSDRLSVHRVDYRDGLRQSSANANNAMRHATGSVLKILFQDDFLVRDDALEQISNGFTHSDTQWLLCGSGISRDGQSVERPMVPRLTPQIRFGRNTVSSPSVLALRAGHDLFFDEALIWLMDVEFYDRCHATLGDPHILPTTLVANRLHEGQVSAAVTKPLRRRELRHVWQKTRSRAGWPDRKAFAYQILKAL